MCGCEQGLCQGCACGCRHTWPPTLDQVKSLIQQQERRAERAEAEARRLRGQVDADSEAWDTWQNIGREQRSRIRAEHHLSELVKNFEIWAEDWKDSDQKVKRGFVSKEIELVLRDSTYGY
jgi:hypothetical protein